MIKTITAKTPSELDTAVNEFEKVQRGFATQTHVVQERNGDLLYIAVVFYVPVKPAWDKE